MLQQLTDKNRLTKAHTQAYRSSLALNRNAAGFSKEFKEGIYTLVCRFRIRMFMLWPLFMM